jgi:hypothetical protein
VFAIAAAPSPNEKNDKEIKQMSRTNVQQVYVVQNHWLKRNRARNARNEERRLERAARRHARRRIHECPAELWFVNADPTDPSDVEIALNAELLERALAGLPWRDKTTGSRRLQIEAARRWSGWPWEDAQNLNLSRPSVDWRADPRLKLPPLSVLYGLLGCGSPAR